MRSLKGKTRLYSRMFVLVGQWVSNLFQHEKETGQNTEYNKNKGVFIARE